MYGMHVIRVVYSDGSTDIFGPFKTGDGAIEWMDTRVDEMPDIDNWSAEPLKSTSVPL